MAGRPADFGAQTVQSLELGAAFFSSLPSRDPWFGGACALYIIAYSGQFVLAGAHPSLPRRNLWMLVGRIWRGKLRVHWCGAGIRLGYGSPNQENFLGGIMCK